VKVEQEIADLSKHKVSVEDLVADEYGVLLCYPGIELESFENRKEQLFKLGVTELVLEGQSKVGKFGVVGKGCVSIVVKARIDNLNEDVALKMRRTDANRPSMDRDFELQSYANSFGVGPRAYGATRDLFAMEFVDSIKIGNWFRSIRTRTPKRVLRPVIRSMLEQCFLLDSKGLDHGELSNPSKHILIRNDSAVPRTVVIDYESASRNRKPSNLTAVGAFLFLSNFQSEKLRKILGSGKRGLSRKKLIDLFGEYKANPNRDAFERIANYLTI